MFRASSCPSRWNQSQQVHTEPPLLREATAARPVLYTIGVVGFVPFSWWWAWWCPKHVETPINTSSSASSWLFIHLHCLSCFSLGSFFTGNSRTQTTTILFPFTFGWRRKLHTSRVSFSNLLLNLYIHSTVRSCVLAVKLLMNPFLPQCCFGRFLGRTLVHSFTSFKPTSKISHFILLYQNSQSSAASQWGQHGFRLWPRQRPSWLKFLVTFSVLRRQISGLQL
jgi:hypothetical protein